MHTGQGNRVVVLGGGPSGLCAAWNLVRDGYKVTLLERESVCGGQSITFSNGGYKYDLGPHNIHSRRPSIIRFLKDNLGYEFNQHNFSAEIFFQGKRLQYPFVGLDILKSVRFSTMAKIALSFLMRRGSSLFMRQFKDDGSYETWIVNRFGRTFYDIFFGPYSEKVWGIPPAELSDQVAKKRIPVTSIIELLHSLLFKTQRYHPENYRLIENYYPKSGVGAISDFFERGIIEGGGEVIKDAPVNKFIFSGSKISKIIYLKGSSEETLDLSEPEGSQVLSTIPVNELIGMMECELPKEVSISASELDFTSEVFLYLNLKKQQAFGIPLLYFSESIFPFNRVYDVGIFSNEMVPKGKNALCFEITCNYGDERYQADDNSLFELCISALEGHGLLHRSQVESYHTRRLEHAYPRFRIGYQKRIKNILGFMESIPNLITFGRQGLFSYANIDDAIWMGFEVAKHLRYKDRMVLSLDELLPDYINY
jgi:protoporphyrinogen oxidase